MINHIIKIIIILFILHINISAQDTLPQETISSEDTVFVMQKSPWGAVLRSAVIPGWGQIYNESYWKAPVFLAIGTWLVYNWIQNDDSYQLYRKLYIQNINTALADEYEFNRNFYRDQRDLFAIYIGLTYILNLVDAYVDAHLFDFTVEEDFLRRPMLGIKFNF